MMNFLGNKPIKFILLVYILSMLAGCNVVHVVTIETSSPTVTQEATPHTPIPTRIITRTPTPLPSLQNVVTIVRTKMREEKVNLFDDGFNVIYSYPDEFGDMQLTTENCNLISITYAMRGSNNSLTYLQEIEITTLDLYGREISKKVVSLDNSLDTEYTYNYVLSPDGRWLAFKRITGVYGMFYDSAIIQDVEIVSVDENKPQKVTRLTELGGAWRSDLVWSPDSRFLAYTDLDSNNNSQVYVYVPETDEKTQLTYLGQEMGDYIFTSLSWSPDSTLLASSIAKMNIERVSEDYYTYTLEDGAVGIIPVSDGRVKWIYPFGSKMITRNIWWDNESDEVLFLADNDSSQSIVIWYDLLSEELSELLPSDLSVAEEFWYVLPLDNVLDIVGLFGNEVYIYSRDTQTYVKKDRALFHLPEFVTSASNLAYPVICIH